VFEALVIGLIGSSALVLGGVIGAYWNAPSRVTGVLLAFASGTLVAALAFELVPEAVEVGGLGSSVLGLFSTRRSEHPPRWVKPCGAFAD
jgi:ZIP family zinc transporter